MFFLYIEKISYRFNKCSLRKTKKTFVPNFILPPLDMSAEGISELYICPSGMAINQYVYLDNCIEARLVPSIREHHSASNYVF